MAHAVLLHPRRVWHPLTGAVLVAALTLLVLPAGLGMGLGERALLPLALLGLGALSGFAVSGST